MTTELSPILQILLALAGISGTVLAGVKAVASWGETRAKTGLIQAQAAAVLTDAEAKKILAMATAADLEARSKAEVIASEVRAQDVGTKERLAILDALEKMLGKVEATKVVADTTQQLVVLANQQITMAMDKTNRHPSSPMTDKQADKELAKHQKTDAEVAAGAPAPPPAGTGELAPPAKEPPTKGATEKEAQLTVAVQNKENIETVSGETVVITGAQEA